MRIAGVLRPITVLGLLSLLAVRVEAAPILPTSYDMPNGIAGSYTYFDSTYNGSGNTAVSGAALSGGLGELTDGIIPTSNWSVTEPPDGDGPYVGWQNFDPTITFHFVAGTTINGVTIYLDDSNGAGGVSPPSAIRINGQQYNIADPAAGAPFAFTVTGLALTGDLQLELLRRGEWTFASEVQFNGIAGVSAVPEPASLTLLGIGMAALAARRRRRG
jgi:hypothetical protein